MKKNQVLDFMDTLEKGDTVIIVTASGRVILDLNDVFETDG